MDFENSETKTKGETEMERSDRKVANEMNIKVIDLRFWTVAIVYSITLFWWGAGAFNKYGNGQYNTAVQTIENNTFPIDSRIYEDPLLTRVMINSSVGGNWRVRGYNSYEVDFLYKLEELLQRHFDWELHLNNSRIILVSKYWRAYIETNHDKSGISEDLLSNIYLDWKAERFVDGHIYYVPSLNPISGFWNWFDSIVWNMIVLGFYFLCVCIVVYNVLMKLVVNYICKSSLGSYDYEYFRTGKLKEVVQGRPNSKSGFVITDLKECENIYFRSLKYKPK